MSFIPEGVSYRLIVSSRIPRLRDGYWMTSEIIAGP